MLGKSLTVEQHIDGALVLTTDKYMLPKDMERAARKVQGSFPGKKVVVLSGGMHLGYIERVDLRKLRDSIDVVLQGQEA